MIKMIFLIMIQNIFVSKNIFLSRYKNLNQIFFCENFLTEKEKNEIKKILPQNTKILCILDTKKKEEKFLLKKISELFLKKKIKINLLILLNRKKKSLEIFNELKMEKKKIKKIEDLLLKKINKKEKIRFNGFNLSHLWYIIPVAFFILIITDCCLIPKMLEKCFKKIKKRNSKVLVNNSPLQMATVRDNETLYSNIATANNNNNRLFIARDIPLTQNNMNLNTPRRILSRNNLNQNQRTRGSLRNFRSVRNFNTNTNRNSIIINENPDIPLNRSSSLRIIPLRRIRETDDPVLRLEPVQQQDQIPLRRIDSIPRINRTRRIMERVEPIVYQDLNRVERIDNSMIETDEIKIHVYKVPDKNISEVDSLQSLKDIKEHKNDQNI